MIPTAQLRFVRRKGKFPADDGTPRQVRILQQLWISEDSYEVQLRAEMDKPPTEWRDIPLVNESA